MWHHKNAIYQYFPIGNIFSPYLYTSKIYHITLINIGAYFTIFSIILKDFCKMVQYYIVFYNIWISLMILEVFIQLHAVWNFLDYEKLNNTSYRGALVLSIIWYYYTILYNIRQYLAISNKILQYFLLYLTIL